MSIQERIDLVGNVSAQARAWMRDINALAASTRALNRAQSVGSSSGGGGGRGSARVAAQSAEAKQLQSIYKAEQNAKSDFDRNMARNDRTAAQGASATATAEKAKKKELDALYKAELKAKTDFEKNMSKHDKEAAKASKSTKGKGPALPRQEVGGLGGILNSAVGNLGAAAGAAAMSALAGMLSSMASTFIAAQVFRENTLAGLTILQKSGTEAKKTWEESFKIARETGSTQQQTMAGIQGMMATGFKKQEAVELFKLMSALSVVNPTANLEGITRAISQIKNTGKLQGDELLQLADAGVSVDAVYDALAKKLGKTREQIIKMQSAGEIKSDVAIQAIKEAMEGTVGGKDKVAEVLKKRANSWQAILGRLQAAPFTFMSGLDKLDPAKSEKLKESLKSLTDMLDPSTEKGARFAAAMGNMLNIISGPGLEAFEKIVTKTGEAAEKFNEASAAASGFSSTLDGIKSKSGGIIDVPQMTGLNSQGLLDSLLGPLYSIPRKLYDLASEAGTSGGDIMTGLAEGMLAGAMGPINSIIAMGAYVFEAIGEFGGQMTSAGYDMAAGLAGGIASGASAAIDAAVSMASGALAAAKSVLGIASPSKAFKKEIGKQLPAGTAGGIYANMGVVEKAAAYMGTTALGTTQQAVNDNMATVQRAASVTGGGASETQRTLPWVGHAMKDAGVGSGSTSNFLGGMKVNAPITMSGSDATPQQVQQHLEAQIQRGVQNFMNKTATAA